MMAITSIAPISMPLLAGSSSNLIVMNSFNRSVILTENVSSGCNTTLLLKKPRVPDQLLSLEQHQRGMRIYYLEKALHPTPSLDEIADLPIIDTSDPRSAFLHMAVTGPFGHTSQENVIPLHHGTVSQVGNFSVAALAADDLPAALQSHIPPWIRQADILLLSGTLTGLDHIIKFLHSQRGPVPLMTFFRIDENYELHSRSWHGRHTHMVGLGPSDKVHASVQYQVGSRDSRYDSLDALRLSIRSVPTRAPWAFRTKQLKYMQRYLNKESRFGIALQFRYKKNVVRRLVKILSAEGRDAREITARAKYAANQTTLHASRYLAYLEKQPDHTHRERSAFLSKTFAELSSSAALTWRGFAWGDNRIILENVPRSRLVHDFIQAFSIYLHLWHYQTKPSSGPYR